MSTWAAKASEAAPKDDQFTTEASGSTNAPASTSASADDTASQSSVRTKKPRIDTLILDAGALIMRAPLDGLASEYYIPPRVVEEIKHASAREYLESLRLRPDFKLHVIQPGTASMVAVSEFAKKTGDIGVLSTQDLEVIALTYEREVSRHGHKRIRSSPDRKRGEAAASTSTSVKKEDEEGQASTSRSSSADAKAARQAAIEKKRQQKAEAKQKQLEEDAAAEGLTVDQLVARRIKENREKKAAKKQAKVATAAEPEPAQQASEQAEEDSQGQASTSHAEAGSEQGWVDDAEYTDQESDGEGDGAWITPDNVQKAKNLSMGFVSDSRMPGWKYVEESKDNLPEPAELLAPEEPLEEGWSRVESSSKAKAKQQQVSNKGHLSRDFNDPSIQSRPSLTWDAMGNTSKEGHMTVACITGDFAVQNVLLQMGLSLLGVHGSRVRAVKSFVLRCHACMKVCKNMEKKFCPVCGNATLTKVAVTVDDTAKGGFQLHLKKNYRFNLRGTKYSIPAPKPGSASGGKTGGSGLILREDQLEWQRALAKEASRKRKEERALEKAMRAGKDSLSVRYEEAWDTGDIFLGSQFASRDKSNLPVIGHGRKNPNANRRTRK
ncbi:related to NOB1-essential nuclear protein involved in proteasome maturation and synthesis of 40S ribosomal subunits [Ustilago bromivora]|uniref:Related to NOB1 - essential nuclear protein involved in proteasome maturation and synthesis of 40S ribosomal subunits n=1 Tax=Ustilago bromivora TaxID=307758 RepID=A0A1K0H0B0_9BASI|nr:related to NOB1-essential nuclear protein involved in proteasome maturation and synthesis of 40S ribosomal subunits [Ustilago bromivora]SYW81456.1 related to NOB1 - essential nuclear protein involved in proteasome maturation and synthesis of 40S ribosomal subunits [Ustilago bromivora]